MRLIDCPRHAEEDAKKYLLSRSWLGLTLGELIDKAASSQPGKIALVDDRVRLTRAELQERVNRLAVGFIHLGIKKGTTVLLQLPNWSEFVYSYFALQKIGAVAVLLISGYRQVEVKHLCHLTEATAWIVPTVYRKAYYGSWIAEVKQANPQLSHVISVRAQERDAHFTASLEELMENPSDFDGEQAIAARWPRPTDVAHILPSGGTTGLPKAIPRTHNDYLCNVKHLHGVGEMQAEDICLLAVPVGHNLALLNMVGAALLGYELVLLDSTRPKDICAAIQTERVSYLPTVPSLLNRVLEFDKISDYNLRSLKKISAGGEPTTPELVEKVYQKLDCRYISEFGMSEGPLSRSRPEDNFQTVYSTVGKPICPCDEFKILDEAGKVLPPESDGELAARGPGIFAGYLKNPEENHQAFTSDGFFRTGDLARIDESGNLKITGRIKDLINRGGEKITPAQVEVFLLSHPDIADAAVIGMPDRELGERVCAYIRPATEKTPRPEEIIAFMESKGASKLLIPERYEFVEALPLTEAGKHDKKALREDIKQRLKKESFKK